MKAFQPDLLDDRSFALVAERGEDGEKTQRELDERRDAIEAAEAAQAQLFGPAPVWKQTPTEARFGL